MPESKRIVSFITTFTGFTVDRPSLVQIDCKDGKNPFPAIVVLKLDETGHLNGDFYAIANDAEIHARVYNACDSLTSVQIGTPIGVSIEAYLTSDSVLPNSPSGSFASTTGDFTRLNTMHSKALFYLPDFPKFFNMEGDRLVTFGDSKRRLGSIELKSSEWEVRIDEIYPVKSDGFTHQGVIQRVDEAEFETPELIELLSILRSFLTFVAGVPRMPSLVKAMGNDNSVTWGRLGFLRPPEYKRNNWFGRHTTNKLSDAFARFVDLYRSDEANVERMIDYYSESQYVANNQIDMTRLALAASASGLEACGKVILGRDRPRTENTLSFVQKALNNISIENRKLVNKRVQFILEERNAYIHVLMMRLQRSRFDDYYEAWKMGQRYIELATLKQLGYDGEYLNRLTFEIETPPWVT